ncbi:hypothetical protein [Rhodococcus sp. HNM0569]|uniref:hypothetical protein n=1 Tax=Rhodococcus sp. HNM0569 TaxID=2716340 RepID=UPI00146BBACF|nr:hypothetical protein [Rhodococcus sp. HNM0569]NLU85084.1 hypothetical protein [Rhodococcus sp. HNM0569]
MAALGGAVAVLGLAAPAAASANPQLCSAFGPGADEEKIDGGAICHTRTEDHSGAYAGSAGGTAYSLPAGNGTFGTAWTVDDRTDPNQVQAGVIPNDGSNVHAVAVGAPGPHPADSTAYIAGSGVRVDGVAVAGPHSEANLRIGEATPAECTGFAVVLSTIGSCVSAAW